MARALDSAAMELPAHAPGMTIEGASGHIGRLAGVRPGAGLQDAYLLIRLKRLFGLRETTHVVPVAWAVASGEADGAEPQGASAGRLRLNATRAQVESCPRLRADAHINRDVSSALRAARLTKGGATLHASVMNGVVELSGHTPGEQGMSRAVACAKAVAGVVAVHNGTTGQEPRE